MIRVVAILAWLALVSLVSLIYEAARTWLLVKPFKRFKEWRRRRKLRKTSWAEHHLDEVSEPFHEEDKETPVLQGKLTYSGIAVLALGWLLERFGVPVASGETKAE